MTKKIILLLTLVSYQIVAFAQNAGDTTSILADTINIHGKVIDQDRNPIVGAEVLAIAFSMHSRYTNGYRRTWTDKNGFFTLNGIKPID
ncbi:MAG: carboxypeptidase regulatory-like domain-containing protein, partial [Chitinophagaceae bacterium]